MNIDRISTAAIFLASLATLVWIIPQQIEVVDYGRVFPSTVPSIAVWIMIICAGIQLLGKVPAMDVSPFVVIRTLVFFVAIVGAVYLMDIVGFEYTAPVLAFCVMLLIGERRWYWLALGTLVIPLGTWLLVEEVLGRQLP